MPKSTSTPTPTRLHAASARPAGDDASLLGPPTDAQREAAALATAQSATNDCAPIRPFYWEVGDQTGKRVGGSVGGSTYQSDTQVDIASASKWLYAAYVLERDDGQPTANDVKFLTFRSGYTDFDACLPDQTVQSCLDMGDNGVYVPQYDGMFYYGGGHMQQHADQIGLGSLNDASLAAVVRTQLGLAMDLAYEEPQPAGGGTASADDYAVFLRKLLAGSLQMTAALGTHAVCTNPLTCSTAAYTPVPLTESWHYSLGHWVEDDPQVGDGAFSSPGAYGFYPWIDASKTYYGVISRDYEDGTGVGFDSVQCGREIRRAFLSGVAVVS